MRTRPPALESYPWRTEHDLRFADMDAVGHINNGTYGSLMESNRCRLFASPDFVEQDGASVVLVRFEIDYLKEMHWPGMAVATCGVVRVGNASFQMRQAIFKDGICTAVALLTGAMMGKDTRRAVAISDPLRACLQRWIMAG